MAYREQPPPADLSALVDAVWFLDSPPGAEAALQLLPDGSTEIVTARAWDADPASELVLVVGPLTRAVPFPIAGPFRAAGVRLRPGAAGGVFGIEARLLRDRPVAAHRLLGHECRGSGTLAEALERLHHELRRRRALPDPALVDLLAHLADGGSLRRSSRALRRAFEREVGLPPSAFLRVTRFKRLLAAAADPRPRTWGDRAAEAGYYDQAHMSREVRALAGVVPTRLLSPCASLLS